MCSACAHARTHTYKPQTWSVQDVKREKKRKSLWKHPFGQALLNHLPKLRWKKKKKNTLKHKVWLLRNASSESVRTTGCIRGSRENKHWRMSFLRTWCFSQPQIPKFARDAAKPIRSRATCDFYLIRVWILWPLGCLCMCVRVTFACKVAREGRLNCARDDFCTAAQSVSSCRDNVFGRLHSDPEGVSSKLNTCLLTAKVFKNHSCVQFSRRPVCPSHGILKTGFSQLRFPSLTWQPMTARTSWWQFQSHPSIQLLLPTGMPGLVETICHLPSGEPSVFAVGYIKRQKVGETQPI